MGRLRPLKHWDGGFELWMSVCVYSVFAMSCLQVEALRQADPPSRESYDCVKHKDQDTEKAAKVLEGVVGE
jgi:hypothetical protein